MQTLSDHILDIAQNSIRAQASRVEIDLQENATEDSLVITIKDNGQGMTNEELDALRDRIRNHPSSDTHSIGLYNINQRISLFYGEGYYMEIDSAIGAGTTVRLKIPKTI